MARRVALVALVGGVTLTTAKMALGIFTCK